MNQCLVHVRWKWRTNLREKWVETKKQFTEIISAPGGSLLVLEHVTWSGRQPPNVALGPRVAGSQLEQGPSQYPKRRLSVRSRKVSKPRDLYLELSDRSEIWPALRQQCCRCACQISKRYDNLKYQSRGCETLRDLTKRRLFGYWDGARVTTGLSTPVIPVSGLVASQSPNFPMVLLKISCSGTRQASVATTSKD